MAKSSDINRGQDSRAATNPSRALYTPEQRIKRDESVWTLVQGLLAPIQFLVFLVSLALVLRYLATGEGQNMAIWSIVIKTIALYTIMITGCIWEKVVFDCYLFAPAFYWEDIFSMLVLTLHTAYLIALFTDMLDSRQCAGARADGWQCGGEHGRLAHQVGHRTQADRQAGGSEQRASRTGAAAGCAASARPAPGLAAPAAHGAARAWPVGRLRGPQARARLDRHG